MSVQSDASAALLPGTTTEQKTGEPQGMFGSWGGKKKSYLTWKSNHRLSSP